MTGHKKNRKAFRASRLSPYRLMHCQTSDATAISPKPPPKQAIKALKSKAIATYAAAAVATAAPT